MSAALIPLFLAVSAIAALDLAMCAWLWRREIQRARARHEAMRRVLAELTGRAAHYWRSTENEKHD